MNDNLLIFEAIKRIKSGWVMFECFMRFSLTGRLSVTFMELNMERVGGEVEEGWKN